MARAHEEELVYTSSEDGLLLEGVALRPLDRQGTAGSIAVVWDREPTIAAIRCPVQALCGAREPGAAETLETIRSRASGAAQVETAIVEDADHVYTGCEAAVASVMAGVLAQWPRVGGGPGATRSAISRT